LSFFPELDRLRSERKPVVEPEPEPEARRGESDDMLSSASFGWRDDVAADEGRGRGGGPQAMGEREEDEL